MSKIHVLPSLIAERIAAGEVIERPASVVKELVENCIDAGSTQIEVRISKGGIDLIEVIDDGCGMGKDDLELCIARHATSKIREFEDLSRLASLGFRGEALPSIASVADLTVTSRAEGTSATHEIHIAHQSANRVSASIVANANFLGSTHGTKIRVVGLFSQIPARLKFLKTPGGEASAIREMLERIALTRPEVGMRLISEDRVLFELPIETLKNRAIRLLSDDNPFEVKEVELEGHYGIHVIWLKGLSFPHTRALYQIVNGRTLRDRTLQMAILNPLKQSFLPGNFPACVVKVNVPAGEIDVNAHPSKTEIRFLDSRKIFALCEAAFSKLLAAERVEFQTYAQAQAAQQTTSGFSYSPNVYSTGAYSAGTPSFQTQEFTPPLSLFSQDSAPTENATPFYDSTPIGNYRGVLFSTYFVFEKDEWLTLIDQHAAHERIRYERLKKAILKNESIETQSLLMPEVVKLPFEKMSMLRDRLALLASLGFEAEVFGEDSVIFRGIPALWGTGNLALRLKNLIERLTDASTKIENLVWDETLFEKIAMEACRSSFKAGDVVHELSALDMTRSLFSCEHPGNCPHGRPTSVRIQKSKVEEWFNRLS